MEEESELCPEEGVSSQALLDDTISALKRCLALTTGQKHSNDEKAAQAVNDKVWLCALASSYNLDILDIP
ncbi:unnamed protein product [Gongylonema pulchrum]|uniref:DZF domain-containing protein n=1 Tax=Gongylonema pulchrum TaxID=637853 RepID=A0A183F0L5_9BILA|nr:unnamed protein product [Gongylonema pulchrum]